MLNITNIWKCILHNLSVVFMRLKLFRLHSIKWHVSKLEFTKTTICLKKNFFFFGLDTCS